MRKPPPDQVMTDQSNEPSSLSKGMKSNSGNNKTKNPQGKTGRGTIVNDQLESVEEGQIDLSYWTS